MIRLLQLLILILQAIYWLCRLIGLKALPLGASKFNLLTPFKIIP